jgi:hypothetical protein
MNWKICLSSVAVAALVACGGKSGGGSTGGTLVLTATPAVVVANGTNAVIIHVDGSQKGPIVVRTDRGHFLESGGLTASNPTTPFDVTLVTCNSQIAPVGCVGNALVNASDQNLASKQIQVRFVGVEICTNAIDDDGDGLIDCADPDCAGQICGPNGKTCSASSPSVCQCPTGQANELPAQCAAAIPVDNDCDGKAGCADSDCLGLSCATGTVVNGNPLFGSCKTGGVCSCVATQIGKETTCGDGIDNDCDGLIDCDDPDCQPVGNGLGGLCDALGHTCSPKAMTGGKSVCGVVCSGNGGTPQLVETNCFDGKDNDCNGVADCQDPNCASQGITCSTSGKTCSAATFSCVCNSPEAATGEQTCDDGIDNDCNGYIDCKDLNCNAKTCGPFGKKCNTTANGTGSCLCPGGTVEICNDNIDNNCDGLADCADPTCRPATVAGVGKDCATGFPLGGGAKCDFSGQCVCPGGQSRETSCGDGADNDCNGYTDCKDLACNGQSCTLPGKVGTVCKTVANGNGNCACPPTAPTAANPAGSDGTFEICSDGIDNNCDGLIDCADPTCQGGGGQLCNPATGTYKCTNIGTPGSPNWVCKDSSNFLITASAAPVKIPADGLATSIITVSVRDLTSGGTGVPVTGGTVTFTVNPGTLATITPTSLTNGSGIATAVLTSASVTQSGSAVVTATYTPVSGPVSAQTTVTLPQLSTITVSQQYSVMGAKGSGWQEQNALTFRLLDSNNSIYPPGLTVSFEHQPLQGSYIGTTASCTPSLCTATGVTDSLGTVTVLLHSGQTAGVVSVTAKAQAGGFTVVSYTATNIAIVGAKASGAAITISCAPRNIPALIDQDCSNSNYAGSDARTTCTVTLADRYKNALGVATTATFETEAGIAGPPAQTPPYDTTKPPLQQTGLGVATDFVKVTGGTLPADVAPLSTEYSLLHNWDGCGPRIHNPRDGLVTVIVKVRGEEGFVDGTNGCPRDGVYNGPGSGIPGCTGENFIDMGEPFVDYNDNGVWDPGEPYDDVNSNGQYDGPNGVWDADATIWAQSRILYTGYELVFQSGGLEQASRFYTVGLPPTPTIPASFTVTSARLASPGPPPVTAMAATSEVVPLFFTDKNFNLPNYKYTYSVTKSGGSNISVGFTGSQPTTLDGLGMDGSQLYCLPDLGSCAVACNWEPCIEVKDLLNRYCKVDETTCASTCNNPGCVPVLFVRNFQYGAYGAMTVTGGGQPDPGTVCGFASGTLTTTNTVNNLSTSVSTTIGVCGTDLLP